MGQWLQRGFDRAKVAKHVWFPTRRKNKRRRRRYRSARGRLREFQICESDDSCVLEEHDNTPADEYLDIFTTEDEYGTIKRFSHRIPLGLWKERSITPQQEYDDSPSPVSLTRYFAVEKGDESPNPNHAVWRFDTEDSLGFGNFSHTKFDETIEAGVSFHTPISSSTDDERRNKKGNTKKKKKYVKKKKPVSPKISTENVCKVMVPSHKQIQIENNLQNKRNQNTAETRKSKPKKHATRDNAYFDQLIQALSRKYWNNNASKETKEIRNQCRKLRGCGDTGDDDTFTNVTELTTKRDFSNNNENANVKSLPLCSSVNRMQAITEETLQGDVTTDIDLYEEGDKASESQSSCGSPTSIRFYQEDNYNDRSQGSQVRNTRDKWLIYLKKIPMH